MARLRSTITASGRPIEEIFAEYDEDGNGTLTSKELRNALRKLNLGLTSKDIDQIMQKIDVNGDGIISYDEFFAELGANLKYDRLMMRRANNKLAELKETMQKYMTSHADAYK